MVLLTYKNSRQIGRYSLQYSKLHWTTYPFKPRQFPVKESFLLVPKLILKNETELNRTLWKLSSCLNMDTRKNVFILLSISLPLRRIWWVLVQDQLERIFLQSGWGWKVKVVLLSKNCSIGATIFSKSTSLPSQLSQNLTKFVFRK